MTKEPFDQKSWERRWAQALRESPEKVASRPPNAHVLEEIGDMQPGFALDAGCGHGSEAIWLASSGGRSLRSTSPRPRSTSPGRKLTLPERTLLSGSSGWKATWAPGARHPDATTS